jgi:co-chaperonin GroES (HSP10)
MKKILKLHPMADYVVIIRRNMPGDKKSGGGIILPDSYKTQETPSAIGNIIAVGPTVNEDIPEDSPLFIKLGDQVVFTPWPMQGCTISTDEGMSAQVIIQRKDVYARFTLDEPNAEDIKKMNELRVEHGRSPLDVPVGAPNA